jgi:hypothetical protein
MSSTQLRLSQLIAPFGPGSIYMDRTGTPLVVRGLDHWYKIYDANIGYIGCDNYDEYVRREPRLSALLNVNEFRIPPDYRKNNQLGHVQNARLTIPAFRFPTWYRNSQTGILRRFNLDTAVIDRLPQGQGRWQPVRFVAMCEAGHMCEFPWKEWCGCQCDNDCNLKLDDRGGSELSSIRVKCTTCPPDSVGRKGRSLAGTTSRPEEGKQSAFQKASIRCNGSRPWLGLSETEQICSSPLVGALINQTNLYFPRTISAISLPTLDSSGSNDELLWTNIRLDPSSVLRAVTLWKMGTPFHDNACQQIRKSLEGRMTEATDEQIFNFLKHECDPKSKSPRTEYSQTLDESPLLAFRRDEFDVLREPVDDPVKVPDLRIIAASVPQSLISWISSVNLVERLKETRAFYGFDRLRPGVATLDNMPDSAMEQLFFTAPDRANQWLPAIEAFGEGIYIELNETAIQQWQFQNDGWLRARISNPFINRLANVPQALVGANGNLAWATRYLLVHTLAHIIINQLVFECGYSTAALRERLFVSSDSTSPMGAFMIYTAAGDSEGTLGGLVRLGRPENLGQVFQRALSRASWCSADPVCSENLGGTGSQLVNLAACHACVLLPETSCETINHGLDRSMVVGTPDNRTVGFLSSILA